VLSLLLLPLGPLAPLPFRIAVASSDWSNVTLRPATSAEQSSFLASPVGMAVSADGTIQLPQSVSAAAGGFGMYQLSFAATHVSGMFSVLQHVFVRVCASPEQPPDISFADASSGYDSSTSRLTCYPRQPCVLRILARHFLTQGNQTALNNASVVTISNTSVAGSSHKLLLVKPGNPAVYDVVFMGDSPEQQPSDADTGREEACCFQAFASSGCPSPPACLSLRIASRPPVALQPQAPSLTSCENETASLLFNISNDDPLETLSFTFDALPLPLSAYGIVVGQATVTPGSAGVSYLSFQLNLSTFSPEELSKRFVSVCLFRLTLLLVRWPSDCGLQQPTSSPTRPKHLPHNSRQCPKRFSSWTKPVFC
jgi:hypothetical protein